MQQYTIYEDYPDLTVERPYFARIFEVSQTVRERDDKGHEADPQKPIVCSWSVNPFPPLPFLLAC